MHSTSSYCGYSKVDHIVQNEHNLTIIMELAENGSLSDVIKSIMNSNGPPNYTNTERQIILFGISEGLKCLHEHKIIHRDIKAANILLDSNFRPRITDFGLSKFIDIENSYEQSRYCGTITYSAPEFLHVNKANRKADVYSFGILMYEIITDSFAYPEVNEGKMSIFDFRNKVVVENYRPKLDGSIKKEFRQLIERCLSADPSKRPSFIEMSRMLADDLLLDDVDIDEYKMYVEDISQYIEPQEGLLHIISVLKEEKKLYIRQLIDFKEQKEMSTTQISDLNAENSQLKKAYSEMKNGKNDISMQNSDLVNENNQLKKAYSEMKNANNEISMQNSDLVNENNQLKKAYSEMKNAKNEISMQNSDLVNENNQLKNAIINLESEKEEALKHISDLSDENNQLKIDISKLKRQNMKNNQNKKEVSKQVSDLDEDDKEHKNDTPILKRKSALIKKSVNHKKILISVYIKEEKEQNLDLNVENMKISEFNSL